MRAPSYEPIIITQFLERGKIIKSVDTWLNFTGVIEWENPTLKAYPVPTAARPFQKGRNSAHFAKAQSWRSRMFTLVQKYEPRRNLMGKGE